jgi:hypothetical protein
MTPLSEWWSERGGGDCRRPIVHADNARFNTGTVSQQFMAQNAMVVAAHSPCSPDPAPSDFYLFGHVKGLLRGELFETGEQLLSAVEGNCRLPRRIDLDQVFS